MKIYAFADEASGNINEQIIALTNNGLNGLEIRNVDGTNVADISEEKAYEVREKMEKAGLKVWSIGSPIGKISLENEEEHFEKFKNVLKVARILGAENIRLFSYFIPKEGAPEDYTEKVIEALKKLVKLAEGSGITLCHENEKGIYGDIPERCLEIHKAIPEIKAIFDPANYIQCGVDTKKAWDMLKKYVKYENGATGVFVTTTGDANGTNRFEIQMDKAKIVAEGDNLKVIEFEMTEQEFSHTTTNAFGSVPAKQIEIETDGKNEQHIGVINAWGGAILRGEPLVAGGEEGINGLTLSNAMHLSSWLGKEVEIPFDEELYYNELMKRVATSKRKVTGKTVFADTSKSYSGSK